MQSSRCVIPFSKGEFEQTYNLLCINGTGKQENPSNSQHKHRQPSISTRDFFPTVCVPTAVRNSISSTPFYIRQFHCTLSGLVDFWQFHPSPGSFFFVDVILRWVGLGTLLKQRAETDNNNWKVKGQTTRPGLAAWLSATATRTTQRTTQRNSHFCGTTDQRKRQTLRKSFFMHPFPFWILLLIYSSIHGGGNQWKVNGKERGWFDLRQNILLTQVHQTTGCTVTCYRSQ